MPEPKPRYASDYTPEQLDWSRRTLLHVASVLGDFRDDIVLVGGLVPMLLVDQEIAADRGDPQVGSMDVDLALSFAVVDEQRYDTLTERLSRHGFAPDTNPAGHPTTQRWVFAHDDRAVAVDFLIDEGESSAGGWGRIMHLSGALGAIRALGAGLAFEDALWCELRGVTLYGDRVARRFQVCGPAAFMVLKALAFRNRGAAKDAYDLGYVLRHFGASIEEVVARFVPLQEHPAAQEALTILREDFADEQALGPREASRFLFRMVDDGYVADFAGAVNLFLQRVVEASGRRCYRTPVIRSGSPPSQEASLMVTQVVR
jgi:hypothetical protein